MKSFTNDEFLRLVEELTEQQYTDEVEEHEHEFSWMPMASYVKDKLKNRPISNGTLDISKVKKEAIKDILCKGTLFKIGIFTIRITKYHSYPNKNDKNQDFKLDLGFLHDVTKTPSGAPCNMQYKFEIGKDSRFANRPWLVYLSDSSNLKNVPINDAVEIIRWFQGLQRMTAFL